jgi:hypothetical protein
MLFITASLYPPDFWKDFFKFKATSLNDGLFNTISTLSLNLKKSFQKSGGYKEAVDEIFIFVGQ